MASVEVNRRIAKTILRRLHSELRLVDPEARALAALLNTQFLAQMDQNELARAARILEELGELAQPPRGSWREMERAYHLLELPENAARFQTRFLAVRPSLERLVEKHGLGVMAGEIRVAAKPSIALVPTRKTDPSSLQFSRLGGLPQLPASLVWPTHQGRALTFIAQIQLSELDGLESIPECPRHGRLYFFCDVESVPPSGWEAEEASRWRVLFTADEAEPLSEAPAPPELAPYELLHPLSILTHRAITIPAPRSIELSRLPEMDSDVWEQYMALMNDLSVGSPRHQLFGHPDAIQGCMQRTAQFISSGLTLPDGVHSWYEHPRAAELMPGAHDWILLLQVDSDENLSDHYWGDAGALYYWIKRDDLINGRFANVWFFMQCT